MAHTFTFVPPPEAPVFRPTEEEFRHPLDYIMKIRHIGTKTGICKIIPPKSWNPPFAVNMKEFTFTPRIQRLYELEASSRVKLNFISRLYKYIRSQGGDKIRVPSIGGRFLDLHALYKIVHDSGGYDKVCREHLWTSVADKLGYSAKYGYSVKTNYEKLLLAFDRLTSSDSVKKRQSGQHRHCSKRLRKSETNVDVSSLSVSKELRNLQFFGPGPKAAIPLCNQRRVCSQSTTSMNIDDFSCRACGLGDDEGNLLVCDNEHCQACYHIYCLVPPLHSIPKFHWKCPECVRSECLQPPDPYGFPQSNKSYALHEFGVMADEFKAAYFGQPCTDVPCSVVEHEFWRILQEYNDDVVVEYGADIHSSKQGSGFPTVPRLQNLVGTAQQLADAKMYAVSPWNLNILPLLDRSVLRFIKGNIDGMKIPWCYVGMVFSSFCWHIEDHWSYSINFNHWGEPKTWYGVSRLHAEDFERAMRKHAPELFDQAPDLLHHITTIMNPNILQAEGVPVYRTDQHCGEFVITFPRAYHAGFNQGFNFAEAVNICLPDWLPIGRACVEHYAEMKRHCVFSNDELLCTLAEVAVGRCRPEDVLALTNPCSSPDTRLPTGCSTAGLDISAIAIVHEEFNLLLSKEKRLRERAASMGIERTEKIRFDELPDDARVCDSCLTTLFLSAVSCLCSAHHVSPSANDEMSVTNDREPQRDTINGSQCQSTDNDESAEETARMRRFMVCLNHCDQLCSTCEPKTWTLKYHYTIEALEDLERSLNSCLTSFYSWRSSLTSLLQCVEPRGWFAKDAKGDFSNQSIIVKRELADTGHNSGCSSTNCSMTLSQLRDTLIHGRAAGYHTDDVFADGSALLERANKLMRTCESLKSSACNPTGTMDKTDKPAQNVQFQFKLPANLSATGDPTKAGSNLTFVTLLHEIDLNNPREIDCVRLLEACKQLHPLDVMDEPSVQFIRRLLQCLDQWRHRARETVSAVCQLSLTNATRSLTMHCFGTSKLSSNSTSEIPIATLSEGLSADEQVDALLSDLLNGIEQEFSAFIRRLPEWISLNHVLQAVQWLCVCQKHTDDKCPQPWTFPQLRHHWKLGEDLLGQLNVLSTTFCSVPKTSTVVHSSTNPSPNSACSNLLTAITSISRLLRARMHTNLGQISQLIVQVESLVSILVETLTSSVTVSHSETLLVLEQFRSLNIAHLICWDHSASDPNDDRNILLPKSELSLPVAEKQHGSESATVHQSSDGTLQLRDALLDRLQQLLASCSIDTSVAARPQLTEAEAILSLGLLVGVLPSKLPDSVSAKEKTLSDVLSKLSSVVSTTHSMSTCLCNSILGEERHESFDAQLLKLLLPKFPTASENDRCLTDFSASYELDPTTSLQLYETVSRQSEEAINGLLGRLIDEGALCISCSLKLSRICSNQKQDCLFCPILSASQSFHSREDIILTLGDPPLCTLQAVAFRGYVNRVNDWKEKLTAVLQSHPEAFQTVTTKMERAGTVLPLSLKNLKITLEMDNQPGSTTNLQAFSSQLRSALAIGYTLSFGIVDYFTFLSSFLGELFSSVL